MGVIIDNLDIWSQALVGTLVLFFAGGALALVLGIIVGAMRVSPIPIARGVGAFRMTHEVCRIRLHPVTKPASSVSLSAGAACRRSPDPGHGRGVRRADLVARSSIITVQFYSGNHGQ